MQVKKIFAAGLTMSMLLGALSGLTACGEHTHELDAVAKKDATCTEAGYEAYYKCSGCDMIFSDEKGEKEITKPTEIPAGHKVEAVPKKDATCKAEGAAAHYKCSVCNTLFSDAAGKNVIAAADPIPLADHTLGYVPEKRSTCTEDGYEEHYKCSVCDKLFADEDGKDPIDKPTPIAAAHRLKAVPRKDATCVAAGYQAYWECTGECKKLFSDENAENTIDKPVAIQPTGIHTLGFGYTAETVPAPEAEGGSLASKCAVCGADMGDTSYKKGFTMTSVMPQGWVKLTDADGAGMYYIKGYDGQRRNTYFGFQANKAGTYKVTFTDVYADADVVRALDSLWINTDNYPTLPMGNLIAGRKWSTQSSVAAKVEQFRSKVVAEGFEEGTISEVKSITFTFTEDDIPENGSLFIVIGLSHNDMSGGGTGAAPTNTCSYLVKYEIPEDQPQA